MKSKLLITILFNFFLFTNLIAQTCINGDCVNGKGTKVNPDGDTVTGNFINGKLNGYGRHVRFGIFEYKGEWKDDKHEGQGTVTNKMWHYTGGFKNNYPDGIGTLEWKNGKKFIGEFKDGYYYKGAEYQDSILLHDGYWYTDLTTRTNTFISESKEAYDYFMVIKSKNYDLYLTTYPNGIYSIEILTLKENEFFNNAKNGFISDCDNYINAFPSGKHITEITLLKGEMVLYNKAINGGLIEYNNYLFKYPNGLYSSEVSAFKSKKQQEIDRGNKIKANSNKAFWKTGNKLCCEMTLGTVCGTLLSWNEDKSMIQFKVISGPKTRIEGEEVKLDAIIWITPNNNWHVCLQDEIDASIAQNEDPYKYWKLGKKICLSGTKGTWIFKSSVIIKGEIIQWNEDRSKVRIRIIDGADGTYYNNETLYNDKMIWDCPNGWKLCE